MKKSGLPIIIIVPTFLTILCVWIQDDLLAQQQYDLDTTSYAQSFFDQSQLFSLPADSKPGQAYMIINTTSPFSDFKANWTGSVLSTNNVNASYQGSEPVSIPLQCVDGRDVYMDFHIASISDIAIWLVDHSGTFGYTPVMPLNMSAGGQTFKVKATCGDALDLETMKEILGEQGPPQPKADEAMIEISAQFIRYDGSVSDKGWSGSVTDGEFDTISFDGRGKDAILISCSDGETFSVSFQKEDADGVLNVKVFDDKGILDEGKTEAKYGLVSLSGTC